jgi:primosomal replication protein N''
MENRDRVCILFDRDREEVRMNPALTGLIGSEEAKRWTETAKELLGRSAIHIGDVIDAFGSLADPRERSLCALPDSTHEVKAGIRQVVCSAVLFHAEFMGQAIGEDLRQMRKESPMGTGLETALRVNKDPIVTPPLPSIPEKERFFTMESDRSSKLDQT